MARNSKVAGTLRVPSAFLFLLFLACVAPLAADELLEVRRQRVQTMDLSAKEELLRQLESFRSMTPDQQERLRRLHDRLEQDPQAEELRLVMHRYYQWLKTLKPYQRAELAELAPQDRVERIKKLVQEQARREAKRVAGTDPARLERLKRLLQDQVPKGAKRLGADDVEGLVRWMEQHVLAKQSELIGELPPARRQELQAILAKTADPARRRELLAVAWFQGQVRNLDKPLAMTPSELDELRSRLSPGTRERLQGLSEAEQRRMVTTWVRLLLLHHASGQHRVKASADVSDDELAEFLEHKINPELRDRLLSLPPEEMRRELWTAYLRSKLPEAAPDLRAPRPKAHPGSSKTPRPHVKKPGASQPSSRETPAMEPPSPSRAVKRTSSGARGSSSSE